MTEPAESFEAFTQWARELVRRVAVLESKLAAHEERERRFSESMFALIEKRDAFRVKCEIPNCDVCAAVKAQ